MPQPSAVSRQVATVLQQPSSASRRRPDTMSQPAQPGQVSFTDGVSTTTTSHGATSLTKAPPMASAAAVSAAASTKTPPAISTCAATSNGLMVSRCTPAPAGAAFITSNGVVSNCAASYGTASPLQNLTGQAPSRQQDPPNQEGYNHEEAIAYFAKQWQDTVKKANKNPGRYKFFNLNDENKK